MGPACDPAGPARGARSGRGACVLADGAAPGDGAGPVAGDLRGGGDRLAAGPSPALGGAAAGRAGRVAVAPPTEAWLQGRRGRRGGGGGRGRGGGRRRAR